MKMWRYLKATILYRFAVVATVITVSVVATACVAEAKVITKKAISLKIDGTNHQLDLYSELGSEMERRPGLLLVPEYWGKDKLLIQPAEVLAGKGYIVLVLDIYGEGRSTTEVAMADKFVEVAEAKGVERVIDLVDRAVTLFKAQAGVDPARLGAVGFGYGGGLVYNLAKGGASGLKVAVSFYGGTKKIRETSRVGRLPELLYLRPAHDVYTSDEEFAVFKAEIAKSGIPYEIFPVNEAYYGFIHKDIEMYGSDEGNTFMHFDSKAAALAWDKTYRFLEEKLKLKTAIK